MMFPAYIIPRLETMMIWTGKKKKNVHKVQHKTTKEGALANQRESLHAAPSKSGSATCVVSASGAKRVHCLDGLLPVRARAETAAECLRNECLN